MIIKGRRRGGAKRLSDHLRRTDENEKVKVHNLEGFVFDVSNGTNLENALRQMEVIGYAKGDKRNLYHTILAPAYGETLNAKQRQFMVDYYAEHMGFKGHQYALVEHWKKGKQHFHLVFNIINPDTGKTHELKFTKYKEWLISRGLEEILGLSTPKPKGKAIPTWAIQRGKHTGIDPIKARKDVTAIFANCKTAKDFIMALDKAGFTLTKGNRNRLVLVDGQGQTHGLMRLIEGKCLADLKRKFHGIDKLPYPLHASLVRMRKPVKGLSEAPPVVIDLKKIQRDVQRAYETSKIGAEFFTKLNKREYSFGRELKGFTLIDRNGGRYNLNDLLGKEAAKAFAKQFPDMVKIKPSPVTEVIRRLWLGMPSRLMWHPLRHVGFLFNMARPSITCRYHQPSFSSKSGHMALPGLRPLVRRLSKIARLRRQPQDRKHHTFPMMRQRKRRGDENIPDSEKMPFRRPEWETAELLAWASENGRTDILADYGAVPVDTYEP
jgi:hypothetical protein